MSETMVRGQSGVLGPLGESSSSAVVFYMYVRCCTPGLLDLDARTNCREALSTSSSIVILLLSAFAMLSVFDVSAFAMLSALSLAAIGGGVCSGLLNPAGLFQ